MNFCSLLFKEIKYFTNLQNKMYQFLLIFQPLLFLTIIYFMRQLRGDASTDQFVVASALISMWSYVLYSSGSALISQKWNDTLKLLISAPISLFQIILSKTISNSFIALLSMILNFLYARFIFQFKIGIDNYFIFFLAVIVLLFSLSVVGLILAIVFVAFQNVFDYQNLILTPIILICGVFIPVEQMPFILRIISYLIPMTWGIKSIYDAISVSSQFMTTIMISIAISIIYFLVAIYIIKKIEIVLRKKGQMGAI